MTTGVLRFSFDPRIPLADAEASLLLAAVAAEGLFGESAVRLGFSYFADAPRRAFLLDATNAVGMAIARMFMRFLTGEFGASAFDVHRMSSPSATRAAA
jgi:hypothetical protein